MKAKQNLEELIIRKFEDVKNSYYRPPLDGPKIIKGPGVRKEERTAFIDLLNLVVGINEDFVRQLSQHENVETVIEGLFTHEFGHYIFHPRELSMALYLSHQAEKVFRELAEDIYALFTDFENNMIIYYQDINREKLARTLKAIYMLAKDSKVITALMLYYKEKMNIDVDINLDRFDRKTRKKILKAVKDLERIIIDSKQDCGFQYSQMVMFGNAIKPLLEEEKNKTYKILICACKSGGSRLIKKENVEDLPIDAKKKVEEAIRKLIVVLPKGVYEEIKKHFLGEEEKEGSDGRGVGIGIGSLDVKLADRRTVEYYREAAKEYGIYIRPRRIRGISSVNIVFGQKDYKLTDPVTNTDTRYSGGKILPGLTKAIRTEKVLYPATIETLPTLILYKDASGSMPDPRNEKCYATIAGAIFVLSYLRSHAKVGIALFDSETSEIFYGYDEDELLAVLCGYKGGGTSIDMERLKEDLEKSKQDYLRLDNKLLEEEVKRNPLFRKYLIKRAHVNVSNLRSESKKITDFVIITDGGIKNIDEVIEFMKENPQYRPTIIHTGGFDLEIPGYDNETSGVYEGIKVLKCNSREDIIKFSKKTIMKNLLSKFYYENV